MTAIKVTAALAAAYVASLVYERYLTMKLVSPPIPFVPLQVITEPELTDGTAEA